MHKYTYMQERQTIMDSEEKKNIRKSNTFSQNDMLLDINNHLLMDCEDTSEKLLSKSSSFSKFEIVNSATNNNDIDSMFKDLSLSNSTKAPNYLSKELRSPQESTSYITSCTGRILGSKEINPNTEDLNLSSKVHIFPDKDSRSETIRWIRTPQELMPSKSMAVDELDNDRNLEISGHNYNDLRKPTAIPGAIPPICVKGNLEEICGKFRGIQGHHNSCYLDATLFSMFTFTSVFDNLLYRPRNAKDCAQYEEVQRVLREEIVNPLRKNFYVGAENVMKLRMLLEELSSISGLTSEEKDPEEFLTSLVAQILKAEPFLKLSSGQETYHYQLFVEKDDELNLPTVQQLLEQSFLASNIRLKEVPSVLIIQMPRFGKSFKMYQKIQPTLLLDITDIIENSPRQCTVCGKLAQYECKECYGECGVGLESIAFCLDCLNTVHKHEKRTNHEPKKLMVPEEFAALQDHCPVFPRLYLELSAVVCIETSHYVSFVKCGSGSDAPWCFFDSMADREGEKNGYNIPEMVPCPDFPHWLSEAGAKELTNLIDDRLLPEHAKRLLCDAYMCMYQSPDVMMYK